MASLQSIEETRDLLVPTHLYYDVGSQSLRTRAIGEILTKILFLKANKKAKFSELSGEAAKIVGVPRLDDNDVRTGLEFLKSQGAVTKRTSGWTLSDEVVQRVERDLNNTRVRIDHILDKHFGSAFDRPTLTKWFKAASAVFFGEYGEIWAHRLKRQPCSLPSAEVLTNKLKRTLVEFHLEKESVPLNEGFESFLRDYADALVDQQIWSFAQSMLSAKLVSASVGPDPLSINEFRSAKLFLDTNVLFLAALEKSRFAKALAALAACLKDIGTTLHIIYDTRGEYETVVARKKQDALRAVENYPLPVVEDAQDPFIKTGMARGCSDAKSFREFFESIQDVPSVVEGQRINLEDDPLIFEAAERGEKDTRKQAEIGLEWAKTHTYKKPKNSILHDARLDSIVNYLRKDGEKAWVVTADRSMQSLSAKWSGQRLPTWIGLDTLVQVMAVSGGGPSHKPENFAPLLTTLIREDIQSRSDTFTLEDLDALLDLEERVKELSKQEIEMFAARMARLRLAGKPKTDSEMQLEIRRTFQRKKLALDEQTYALETEVRSVREDLRKESDLRQAAADALVTQLAAARTRKELLNWALKLLGISIAGALITSYGAFLWRSGYSNLGAIVVGIGITEILLPTLRWVLPGFRKSTAQAKKWAEQEASRLVRGIQKE